MLKCQMHLRDLKQETSLFIGIIVLWGVEISCSAELSMKKGFITSGPGINLTFTGSMVTKMATKIS